MPHSFQYISLIWADLAILYRIEMILMVFAPVHASDDWCWHVLFTFWVFGDILVSLRCDLCVRMHPFEAPQCQLDGLVLGRFGKNAQDRNDALRCVPLSIELMIAAGTFHLPCW